MRAPIDIFVELDALSKERALTKEESIALETAMRMIRAEAVKRDRMTPCPTCGAHPPVRKVAAQNGVSVRTVVRVTQGLRG